MSASQYSSAQSSGPGGDYSKDFKNRQSVHSATRRKSLRAHQGKISDFLDTLKERVSLSLLLLNRNIIIRLPKR